MIGFRLRHVGRLILSWSYFFVDLHATVQVVDSANSEVRFAIGAGSSFSFVNY